MADTRKTHTIQIRVSGSQRDLLQTAADSAHLDLSTWIRMVALTNAQETFDPEKIGGTSKPKRRTK